VAQYFVVHPTHPQPRLIAYPTDSCYALGCRTGDKDAMLRLRHIRGVDTRHHFTLMCRDLSELATYARVDNARYRLLKSLTPGSYTFILEATRELPRRVMHPQRRTIGLRVPDHVVACALLEELDEPLLSTTLHLPGDELPLNDAREIRRRLEDEVELVLDGGFCGTEPTTVIDLTGREVRVLRSGKGAAREAR
jgi:tRNA threonylcarbamoyl adenosine modification protein (Sua5/YciO/YrdC/YwlC family)